MLARAAAPVEPAKSSMTRQERKQPTDGPWLPPTRPEGTGQRARVTWERRRVVQHGDGDRGPTVQVWSVARGRAFLASSVAGESSAQRRAENARAGSEPGELECGSECVQ
jgi:hypothetical protein